MSGSNLKQMMPTFRRKNKTTLPGKIRPRHFEGRSVEAAALAILTAEAEV